MPSSTICQTRQEYVQKIDAVDFKGVVKKTELQEAPVLSRTLGRKIFLKREDQQSVFSFKIRGAANKISHLNEAQKKAGVITASAGNHAQGVALAAKRFGIEATIVMPRTTPEIKVNAVKAHGARVVLFGDSFPEALQKAQELQAEKGFTFVHPYDDEDVIVGQGTIGKEMLEQTPEPLEAVFVQVGGGGLAAGVAAALKAKDPSLKVYTVEPEGSCCLAEAMKTGKPVKLDRVELFADGVAVAQIGERPFALLKNLIDGTILVSTDEICAAAWDVFGDTRIMPEPAGAVGLAGLKKFASMNNGTGALATIVSGANVDSEKVRYMAERIASGQKKELLLSVQLPERPGALLGFCEALGTLGITEFNYRYANAEAARIFVGLRVQDCEKDGTVLFKKLKDSGYQATDLTGNDLAKEHIRHMVGGRPPCRLNEVLYSFVFPEHPGALLGFLKQMPSDWNISLFHYRCHGASHGRVLMGLQVPLTDRPKAKELLENGPYRGNDETQNPAYAQFLGIAEAA